MFSFYPKDIALNICQFFVTFNVTTVLNHTFPLFMRLSAYFCSTTPPSNH